MKVAVGGDHAGFTLRQAVIQIIKDLGHTPVDFGCYSLEDADFPGYAEKACLSIVNKECERGILVCGSGVGVSIVANKIPGIRASVCHDYYLAHQSVEHDDVNVMCFGGKVIGEWLAADLVKAFLDATFSTNKDVRRRVSQMNDIEAKYSARK